ncbi:hypothetical protein [Streptacidiphilus sp. P02-A3a]|uniref:hypothetical protein n=1 Tax=Streptacidiphilus sp. P02-A3a TaxID=2704468 RepID=UPI0015F84975|nr:hypothetical protein [Streptacidiphilus sp. P02-A3a]QMU68146.1 hypothetical protein GXP74_07835 [Streptacidiphilus sp. P02-A3a]
MSDPLVQIQIRGAGVAIINGTVYAALIAPPNAATWVASSGPDGSTVFTDQASGLVLSAQSTDPGTQAVVTPSGTAPISSWNVVRYADEQGDDATPIKDAGELVSGYYTLQDPASGTYLFRNGIEDRSLRPKFVGFPSYQGDGEYELVIQVVGDGDDD